LPEKIIPRIIEESSEPNRKLRQIREGFHKPIKFPPGSSMIREGSVRFQDDPHRVQADSRTVEKQDHPDDLHRQDRQESGTAPRRNLQRLSNSLLLPHSLPPFLFLLLLLLLLPKEYQRVEREDGDRRGGRGRRRRRRKGRCMELTRCN